MIIHKKENRNHIKYGQNNRPHLPTTPDSFKNKQTITNKNKQRSGLELIKLLSMFFVPILQNQPIRMLDLLLPVRFLCSEY